MAKVAGYIIRLSNERYVSLHYNLYNRFVEPVPDFKHPRNTPLVCFIVNDAENITHIGMGTRGERAGTDLSKMNIEKIYSLQEPCNIRSIIDKVSSKVSYNIALKIRTGGLLRDKSFDEFLTEFLLKAPDTVQILEKYTQERASRIKRLSSSVQNSLAEQQQAVLTAMNIAGIDRDSALGWDYKESDGPISFLDGLEHARLREDQMILNDLNNMPGFNLLKSTKFSSSVFKNEETRLTVLLANRLPLEELMGTDLIYFNENFRCFVMIQYKVMEKENDCYRFRLPDKQLSEEISRMEAIYDKIKATQGDNTIDHYRISEAPFFIKICQRLDFKPDDAGLCPGMYIPLDYIKMLEKDQCIYGKNGGRGITYDNVGRYFDNTAFKIIIEGGWIGTNPNQSLLIEEIIKDILQHGKTAVIAIKKDLVRKTSNRWPRKTKSK